MSNPITVTLDLVSFFQLEEELNFEWLRDMGTVFYVFDQQDSGNISFGIRKQDGSKKFVKYAGAHTIEYSEDPEKAVERLKHAIPIYEDLAHEHLIGLTDHFADQNGYALVYNQDM